MATQVSSDDIAMATSLLDNLKHAAGNVSNHIQGLLHQIQAGELPSAKGVSFLEVKNQLMLSYLINLSHMMCTKTKGQSISGSPSIDRLVEIRTVIEKMRPIDQKLKYQVDKLVKTATTGIGENDPLRYKPNPSNLVSKLEGESESEAGSEDEEDGQSKVEKYKPPKLAAVHYEGDETQIDRKMKAEERAKKRALSSSIIRELRDEYYQGPEEIHETPDLHRLRADKEGKERREYEEKYFMRMPVTKKQKAASRSLTTMSALDSLTHFGDISALTGEAVDDGKKGKKRKLSKGKGKGKKKGTKKRRYR